MKLIRFSTAGASPRLGAVLGTWDHWERVVDLSAADSGIPPDTLGFIDACPELKGDVWARAVRVLSDAKQIEADSPPWALPPGGVRAISPMAPRLLRDLSAVRSNAARPGSSVREPLAAGWV